MPRKLTRMDFALTVEVSTRLRRARAAAGLTQGQLAERIGASRPQIAKLENRWGMPGIVMLRDWAVACGTTMSAMLADAEKALDGV